MTTAIELGLKKGDFATLNAQESADFWKREQAMYDEKVIVAADHGWDLKAHRNFVPDRTPVTQVVCLIIKDISEGGKVLGYEYVVARVNPDGSHAEDEGVIYGNEDVFLDNPVSDPAIPSP